jgi:anti-anti-sigma factor
MAYRTVIEAGRATVFLDGRISFRSYPDFRAAALSVLEDLGVKEIYLDMAGVEFLDSSALGMILHFNQKAITAAKALAITHPTPTIATILRVVNFGRLVTILP